MDILHNNLKLKNNTRVLITAGASGIGLSIAHTFAQHGAHIQICDIDKHTLKECQRENPDFVTTLCDVAVENQVHHMFEVMEKHLGGLDILINNAGVAGPIAPVEDIKLQQWRQTIDVNLNAQFYCAQLAVPYLKSTIDGAIINISSIAGRFGFVHRSPYSASKWGVIGLTQSLAKELGPSGIRVNAILPGAVHGPRMEKIIKARAEEKGVTYDDVLKEIVGNISLRRLVTAEDIANMALYLCSPLGRNISGQSISVCGNTEYL